VYLNKVELIEAQQKEVKVVASVWRRTKRGKVEQSEQRIQNFSYKISMF
jgi:hypothetical protein